MKRWRIDEVCRELGISEPTARRMIKRGELPVMTFAGRVLKPFQFDPVAVRGLIGNGRGSLTIRRKPKTQESSAPESEWSAVWQG